MKCEQCDVEFNPINHYCISCKDNPNPRDADNFRESKITLNECKFALDGIKLPIGGDWSWSLINVECGQYSDDYKLIIVSGGIEISKSVMFMRCRSRNDRIKITSDDFHLPIENYK